MPDIYLRHMHPYNKIELLEELRELVAEALDESHSTRFGTGPEKKHHRKLKRLHKGLNRWIEGLEEKDKINETTLDA